MYILDTDHLTLLERGGSAALLLELRIGKVPQDQLATTIVSYEEQMRGWLSYSARARTQLEMIDAYALLYSHVERFRRSLLLPFDHAAAVYYEALLKAKIRVGTMDLRIAAVTLAHDAILVTRNLSDFRKVPGLKFEDWSQ